MTEIRAKAYFEKATDGWGGLVGKPAGWVICNIDTGKPLDSHRFATEDEAKAAMPTVLAQVTARIDAAKQSDRRSQSAPARPYRTTRSGAFGDGRVYDDQPGATRYDDGSGTYKVQIWDNS